MSEWFGNLDCDYDNFREIKAESERRFLFSENGFVENISFDDITREGNRFFVGRKGCGKTAHKMALLTFAKSAARTVTDDISLGRFDPKRFFEFIDNIERHLSGSRAILYRNLWRYTICVRLMCILRDAHSARLRLPASSVDFSNMTRYLERMGFGPDRKELPTIEYVAEITSSRITDFLANHAKADATDSFPTDDDFAQAAIVLKRILKDANGALVCIDDLDRWIESYNYELMLPLVEGLIYCITELSDDHMPDVGFSAKVFIPEDLFRKVEFRHMDKEKVRVQYFSWNTLALKELIARRVARSRSKRDHPSQQAINQYLGRLFPRYPDSVVSDPGGVQRNALEYVLLFTHYRPRDVIFYIQNVIREHQRSHGTQGAFTQQDILTGVENASRSYVQGVLQEYGQRMPYLGDVVNLFFRKRAIYHLDEFKKSLEPYFGDSHDVPPSGLQRLIDDLYELGFMGKFASARAKGVIADPVKTPDDEVYLQFSYAVPKTKFDETSLIIIHPSFWSELEIKWPARTLFRRVIEPS